MLRNTSSQLAVLSRRLPSAPTHLRAATSDASSSVASGSKPRPSPKPAHLSLADLKVKHGMPRRQNGKQRATNPAPPGKRLLKPYDLSLRLQKMCNEGDIDKAVETLKNMPLDAQNTPTWNTMVQRAGQAGRLQLAYSLYLDMKRRGFKPSIRTFGSFIGACTLVDSWEKQGKLLQNVHNMYQSYREYVDEVKQHNPSSPEYSAFPAQAYIMILSKAKQWQKMFDVYNSLDDEGPFSPAVSTYTVMLWGLYSRGKENEDPETPGRRSPSESAASDARFVWRQLIRRIENGAKLTIDDRLLCSYMSVLTLGRPADHIAAFDALRDYAGLAKPGETAPPSTVKLTPFLLSTTLNLCNVVKKPRLCVHFMKHAMTRYPDIVQTVHVDHLLSAYGSLAALGSLSEAASALQALEWLLEREATTPPKEAHYVRPRLSTYALTLIACWRAKDWASALRVFELMTGYSAADFADKTRVADPQPAKRSKGRNLVPDAATLSLLARTALAAGGAVPARQCMRIMHTVGLTQVLERGAATDEASPEGSKQTHGQPPRFDRDVRYHVYKTADAVVKLVNLLVPPKGTEGMPARRPPLKDEQRQWVDMRTAARSLLIAHHYQQPQKAPALEEQLLGSEMGVAATDDAVRWDRISRESKIRRT